jgi:hypothetical protein
MFFFYFNFFNVAGLTAGMFLVNDDHVTMGTSFFDDDDVRMATTSFHDDGAGVTVSFDYHNVGTPFDDDGAGTPVYDDHLFTASFMASGQGTQAQNHDDKQGVSDQIFGHSF